VLICPSGKISDGFGHELAVDLPTSREKALRVGTNFTSHFNVIWVVQIGRGK
jgi:hypothetical protein